MEIVRCEDPVVITKFQTLLHTHHHKFLDRKFFKKHTLPYQKQNEVEEVWIARTAIFDMGYIHTANTKKGRLHIAGLYVFPHYRRQGVGRALINHAFERARAWGGIDSISLSAYVTNEDAIALYKKMGFVPRYIAMYKEV